MHPDHNRRAFGFLVDWSIFFIYCDCDL